jgi:hypothetical protein
VPLQDRPKIRSCEPVIAMKKKAVAPTIPDMRSGKFKTKLPSSSDDGSPL